jgi:two-component system, NtrC family, response regulator PilR
VSAQTNRTAHEIFSATPKSHLNLPIRSEGRDYETMLTKKILIVDDNPNMSVLLSDILEIFDFEGLHAADGDEALDKLRRGKYDMVFTDLRMPKMDGLDLLKAIKSEHPGLPVVVVTGYSLAETRDEVLSEKADGFLSKPFKVNEIQALLTSLLGQQL